MARDPRLLLRRRAARHDGDAQGDEDVSNIHYFGEPVYTYSLKQGIEDGFLAPYKVVRVDLDKDLPAGAPRRASATSTAR